MTWWVWFVCVAAGVLFLTTMVFLRLWLRDRKVSCDENDDPPDHISKTVEQQRACHPFSVWVHGPAADPDLHYIKLKDLPLRAGVNLDTVEAQAPLRLIYDQGQLLPVFNQQACNTCYAVTALQSVGDRAALNLGVKQQWSVQEMVNCLGHSCDTEGTPVQVWEFMQEQGALKATLVPYDGRTRSEVQPCNAAALEATENGRQRLYVSGVYRISETDDSRDVSQGTVPETASADVQAKRVTVVKRLIHELANYGPAATIIQVYKDFYFYQASTINDKPVTYKTVNPGSPSNPFRGYHAVEILGYNHPHLRTDFTNFEGAHWICRNSWGNWPAIKYEGQAGYFFIPMEVERDTLGFLTGLCAADPALVEF